APGSGFLLRGLSFQPARQRVQKVPENKCESAFTSAGPVVLLLSIGSHFALLQLESCGMGA
ncbi:hypothetical protein, partial [Aeromonas salmonicida]|uniref:hypothetical protein n=1 Tax=Aeromonas salmonicida TaxID=645 RepID=UPI001F2E5E19